MDPEGAQMEPQNQQTEPQGPAKYENHVKMEAPSVTMESQGRPKYKKSTKKSPKVVIRHENVPQGAENTHGPKQPTNQPTKETKGDTNQQTSKQTNKPTYTFTQINALTTRPLESSFEMQTQTQTPAAGCSPQAT